MKHAITRRSALLAGTAALAAPANATTPDRASQATSLGLEMIPRLRAVAESNVHDVHCIDLPGAPGYDAEKSEACDQAARAAFDALEDAADAILEAASRAPREHLIDLAIVARCFYFNDCDTHEKADAAARIITAYLIGEAGIDRRTCSHAAHYRAAVERLGLMPEPFCRGVDDDENRVA